jgi:hypothetical protein
MRAPRNASARALVGVTRAGVEPRGCDAFEVVLDAEEVLKTWREPVRQAGP